MPFVTQVEGSIRKKDDKRKRQRESRLARKQAEQEEAASELRRLKNIKKKELDKRFDCKFAFYVKQK